MTSAASFAENYTAVQTSEWGLAVVRLSDANSGVQVGVVPAVGNRAYEMKVRGENILYSAHEDLTRLRETHELSGVTFLAPWANRLSEEAFWANGWKYHLNRSLGNIRGDLPIHGLLIGSDRWQLQEVAADAVSAHVTSRLEFWKYPDLMAQWPFAHEYEMIYRLSAGVLEVRLAITNRGAEPMPVVVGFHPYLTIPGIPRDSWTAQIPARETIVTDQRLIPTGERKPVDFTNPLELRNRTFDTGFTSLDRDAAGRAHFWIESGGRKIEELFGPKYQVSVIWEPAAPPGETRNFICFEPMAGITDALNLYNAGKYPELQSVPAGGQWSESFWIRASGF